MASDKSWLDDAPIIRAAPSVPAEQTTDETVDVAGEGTMAVPKSQTRPPPIASLEDARDLIQRGDMAALQYLKPAPDESAVTSAAKKAAMVGVHGGATLLQMPINALLGLTQGPRVENGQITVPALRMNPETGAPQLTPEAQTTVGVAATPLRFGPRGPVPSPGTFNRDTTVTGVNSVDPAVVARAEGRTAFRGTQGEPPAATSQTGEFIPPTSRGTTQAEAGASQPAPPITSSQQLFDIADKYYGTFDQAARDGGSLTPAVTNKVIARVEADLPKSGMAEAFGAGDELKKVVGKLQQYKDKPMTLEDVKAVDQQIGRLIHAENDPIKGLSPHGRVLANIQDDLRELTEHPAPSDVVGGQAGLDALAPARKAYSQARKVEELERLWEKAQGTQNPTTSYQTQINNLFSNRRRSAGFTDEEVAAVKDLASRGIVGGGLHLLGSRLIPIIAGAAEVGTHGLTAGAAAFGTSYLGGTAMRSLENRIAASRFEKAKGRIGQGAPSPPPNALLGLGP